jgi:fatty acid desaturase
MKITKIHGKYYDLTNFNHPGGDIALYHSFERDATILFESHHPFVPKDKLYSILEKYEVSELPSGYKLLPNEDTVPQFEFDTEFANEIKDEVKKYFEQESKYCDVKLLEATKATIWRWALIVLLTIFRIIGLWQWINGNWVGLITFPVTSWIAGSNTFHDACHFALSSNQKLNALVGYTFPELVSPLSWYHQHNIAHHAYTNIDHRDPDAHHIQFFKRALPTTKYKSIYKYQKYTVFSEFVLEYLGLAIIPAIENLIANTYFGMVYSVKNEKLIKTGMLHVLFGLFLTALPLFIFEFPKGLIFCIVPKIIFSILFMVSSQITHLQTNCIKFDTDWYKHQVITASNHGMGKWFNFVFSGGLNYQIEHHLFPNVNHCHHPYIQPIIKKICQKHGVEYKEFDGYKDAFTSYYNHIVLMGEPNSE